MAGAFLLVEDTRIRLALVAGASISDWLDGWLARRREHGTSWGALLDPIADKTFVLSALAAFLLEGSLSLGQLLVVLSRGDAQALAHLAFGQGDLWVLFAATGWALYTVLQKRLSLPAVPDSARPPSTRNTSWATGSGTNSQWNGFASAIS